MKVSEYATAPLVNGCSLLGEDQSGRVRRFLSTAIREKLQTARTYYVRAADGSDSNDGLTNSASGAFATLQYAWDFLSASLDLGNNNLTIRLIGAGPYICDPFIGFSGNFVSNNGAVILQGDGITTEVQDAYWFGCMTCSDIVVMDVKLTAPVQAIGAQTFMTGRVDLRGNIAFENCSTACMFASNTGTLLVSEGAQISVSGNGQAFAYAADMGQVYFESGGGNDTLVTLTGTPAFSFATVVGENQGQINFASGTFSGAATGVRYFADALSLITSGGRGANFFPGDQVGVALNGGVYI